MSTRSAARRYAAALFAVTHKAGTAEQAGRQLDALSRLIGSHADLARALASPAVPLSAKRDIVVAVIEAAGGTSAEVTRMAAMLAERDRLTELPEVAAAFEARLMEAQRVLRADVVTAVPLSDASRTALTTALGRATGKSVTIDARVDPAIIGGIIARVGSRVYDASITRQLERMKDKLSTNL